MESQKVTIASLQKKKATGQKITMMTAYDYPTAALVDQAGIDTILVGDSLGMVMLGYQSTVPVTMDEMDICPLCPIISALETPSLTQAGSSRRQDAIV